MNNTETEIPSSDGKVNNTDNTVPEVKSKLKELDVWLIRPCEVYKAEHQDCKRLQTRIYQHYMYGEQQDCSQWMTDFKNCLLFRQKSDNQAKEELLASEKERRQARLSAAKANNIWEYRTKPPDVWSKPLEEINPVQMQQDDLPPDL